MERLDIVICTHNRAAALDRCLQVLGQQDAPGGWRVTVIDNNSTDATAAVVARHVDSGSLPGLARIFEAVPGLTAARQRAMCESRAEWVAFVDDDCLLRAGWIVNALRVAADHPTASAFGGRVLPDWGRPAPAHLDRNGWLFAHQDFGSSITEVDSLVGAGLVLNRSALAATGWTEKPLLADRIGRGFASGGDVEISLRLKACGGSLLYVPEMALDHLIAEERQKMQALTALAGGLGAGAALASLLTTTDFNRWCKDEKDRLVAARSRHDRSLIFVLRRRYSVADWRILRAFLAGQSRQVKAVSDDPDAYRDLAGACRPRDAALAEGI